MIKIIIENNIWCKLLNIKDVGLMDCLDDSTSFFVDGYKYTKAYVNGYWNPNLKQFVHWDGKKHLLTKNMIFPIGLLKRITKIIEDNGREYEIIDKREKIIFGKEIEITGLSPRDYQLDALKSVSLNDRGIIRLATGGGKTLIASLIVSKFNIPSMVYVIGKDLLYQFHSFLEKTLNQKIGIIGDGKCEIEKFNVCSVWTAIKAFNLNTSASLDDEDWCPEIINMKEGDKEKIRKAIVESNLAIFDEAHFLATETIQSIFKISKSCRYMYGLTASDWRDDGADLLLESICGERIYNLPASPLIKRGFLVPPHIILYNVPALKEELPKHYQSVYKKYIIENDVRNKLIEDCARKAISRGNKLLILVRYLSHGDEIVKRLNDVSLFFVNGEISGETRLRVREQLEKGELQCLIASSVFDIGVDIPSLDAIIMAGGGKSTVRTLQRIGRVIRSFPGKKSAIVIDFIDNAKYLDKHSATRIAVYKTEKEFKIKYPQGVSDGDIKKIKKLPKKLIM